MIDKPAEFQGAPHPSLMASLWQVLFETATDAIIIDDPSNGLILDVNRTACDLYGYSPQEMAGMPIMQLTAEPDATREALITQATRAPLRYHVKKDGTVFPVEITGNRFSLNGRPIRVAFVRDITERIQAAEALRASEAKFSTAFKTTPDAININRMADGLFIEINDGFTRLTGYTLEDVTGKTSYDLDIWVDLSNRDRLVAGLRESGVVENLEAQFRFKSGEICTGLMSARVMAIDGEFCILSVTRDITERKQAEEELERTNRELEAALRGITEALGRTVEVRDPYTGGHERRVARLCCAIAERLALPQFEADCVEMAALIHDLGKIGVPADILSKPGRLSELELRLVQEHPVRGAEILSGIRMPWPLADIVRQHHERIDGSGYPDGLTGEQICREARILAVADVVEAMSSHRPYRAALGVDAAMDELSANAHKFDPDVLVACTELREEGAFDFLSE